MPTTRLQFPRGVSDAGPFAEQPAGVAPPAGLLNFIPDDQGRERGRARPGARRLFGPLAGPVQNMLSVQRSTAAVGVQVASCRRPESWLDRLSGPVFGHVFGLTANTWAMFSNIHDNRGSGAEGVQAVSFHPTGNTLAFVLNWTDGTTSKSACGVRYCDAGGATLWTAEVKDTASVGPWFDYFGRSVEVTTEHTLVAINEWMYVFRNSDGAYVARYADGYGSQTREIRARPDGKVAVLSFGASQAADTTPFVNQPGVVLVKECWHYLSNVSLWEPTGDPANPYRKVNFQSYPATGSWYINLHGTFRFAEHSAAGPRGCFPCSLTCRADNSIVVARTNAGWGPNGNYTPGGEGVRYVSIVAISENGEQLWEADPESIRRAYTGPWGTIYNDIPDPAYAGAGATATWECITADARGDLYVAGTRNAAGINAVKLSGLDGSRVWGVDLGARITPDSIAIDPTDQSVVVGGTRNSAWTGSGGTNAHLWKLNPRTGAVLQSFDIATDPINVFGLDVDRSGRVAIATGFIS